MKKIEKLSAAAFTTAVREGGFFYNNTAMAKKTARRKPCCASDLQIREVTTYPYRQGISTVRTDRHLLYSSFYLII